MFEHRFGLHETSLVRQTPCSELITVITQSLPSAKSQIESLNLENHFKIINHQLAKIESVYLKSFL